MSTDPLFMKVGSAYYYYHNDHLGTPQKITSVSGAVVWSAKYSSFGEASVEVGTVVNNLRFPGQYWDSETGIHYNWNRYYLNIIGKYLRMDPIGLESGNINFYNYAAGNPINQFDPTGLCTLVTKIPINFDYQSKEKWNSWSRWTYEDSNTYSGGQFPVFWYNAKCRCVRNRTGTERTTIKILWEYIYLCEKPPCGYEFKSSKRWDYIYDNTSDLQKSDRKEIDGGWVLNDVEAAWRCREKCDQLNH